MVVDPNNGAAMFEGPPKNSAVFPKNERHGPTTLLRPQGTREVCFYDDGSLEKQDGTSVILSLNE